MTAVNICVCKCKSMSPTFKHDMVLLILISELVEQIIVISSSDKDSSSMINRINRFRVWRIEHVFGPSNITLLTHLKIRATWRNFWHLLRCISYQQISLPNANSRKPKWFASNLQAVKLFATNQYLWNARRAWKSQ